MPDHEELGGGVQGPPPLLLGARHRILPEGLVLPRPELLQPPLALGQVRVEARVQPQHVRGPRR